MKGKYLDWNSYAICAICGKSGSGKTSTTRFILTQLAMNGVGLIVGDYHGMLDRDNLASTIEPLQPAMIRPIARNHDEMIASIKYVNTLLEDRLAGNGDSRRVALVLDEVAAFFIGCEREELDLIAKMFLRLANEGRKCNIRVFLLSQSFLSDFIGSRSVRSSITHVIFHRSNEDEVKLLSPSMPTQMKRKIAQLKPGHAFFYPDMVFVQIPYITQDDLTMVQIPHVEWKQVTKKTDGFLRDLLRDPIRDQGRDQPRDRIVTQEKEREPMITQQEVIKAIIGGIRAKESKEQTILRVLKIRKGGKSQKWIIASRLYDTVKERIGAL